MSRLLPTISVEKPWGKDRLPAPFATPDGKRIGEIWFEPPPELDRLLVKYIFTSEKLSVQVHPDDEQSEAAGKGRQGKSECWYVIDADPGATLGIGLAGHADTETLRAAALDGSIEDMLVWHNVRAGDFFYIPANTVHAIGAGVSLIEVQQNSDITYRLYDYGRPRELHLDEGVAVARGEPYPPQCRKAVAESARVTLVEGPHFRFSQCAGEPDAAMRARHPGVVQLLPLEGEIAIDGETVAGGECGLAEAIDAVDFSRAKRTLLVSAA